MARSSGSYSPSTPATVKSSPDKPAPAVSAVRWSAISCSPPSNAASAPYPVQWLADNGSAYTARETLDFAAALGLSPCFTPVRSPESNGISEAFVKTLKRDYARIQPRPDALTVLQQLSAWIDDYNENHPHSGLRMHSPHEFIQSQSQPAPCPV